MAVERIPERQTEKTVTNNIYYKEKRFIGSSVLIDWVLTISLIVLILFITASYFVEFSGSFEINLKKSATDTAWVMIAILCVKELAKHLFKRKGQRTKDYINAEKKAKTAIHTLNENVSVVKVQEYCNNVTKNTINNYRTYQLTTVGIELEEFNMLYLGQGFFFLLKNVLTQELSILQARAIWRCNHVKTKPYNHKFITSYNAEDNSEYVPSQLNDVKRADINHSIRSLMFTFCSSFCVGFVFKDIFLNFSREMIFLSIIKVIILMVSFSISAIVGWNLSVIEQARNESRVSEVTACLQYAGVKIQKETTTENTQEKE